MKPVGKVRASKRVSVAWEECLQGDCVGSRQWGENEQRRSSRTVGEKSMKALGSLVVILSVWVATIFHSPCKVPSVLGGTRHLPRRMVRY